MRPPAQQFPVHATVRHQRCQCRNVCGCRGTWQWHDTLPMLEYFISKKIRSPRRMAAGRGRRGAAPQQIFMHESMPFTRLPFIRWDPEEPQCQCRMSARRQAIKGRAAALEAAEAQRRFQAETLGEEAQPAEGPNQDRFVQQLTGRVRVLSPLLLLFQMPFRA